MTDMKAGLIKTRLITDFSQQEERRAAAGIDFTRWYGPGAMWLCPWYYDPANPEEHIKGFLSQHYLSDWATLRPPLMVICPDGSHWCPDQKSSNGTGWAVAGEAPNITCTPSIVVKGYHGFLRGGVFTADLDANREPMEWTPPVESRA